MRIMPFKRFRSSFAKGSKTASGATAVVVLALLVSTSAKADVKIHGATTVAFGLIKPQKDKIEKLAGVELTVLPSSTGHGLADLVQGHADIAMLAEPLETAVEAFNKKAAERINPADYAGRHVGDALVQIIVHLSNPIRKLTKEQLADLFSGKIKNWAELGGNSQPVLLVGESTSSPYRMIKEALAISYPPDMRIVQNTNQTAIIVAQAPGAISNISTAHDVPERSKLKVVETELNLPLHLYLAFRKDASDEVKRVVDAAASIGAP
jgi:phosphate transport system substrate-binding protein